MPEMLSAADAARLRRYAEATAIEISRALYRPPVESFPLERSAEEAQFWRRVTLFMERSHPDA